MYFYTMGIIRKENIHSKGTNTDESVDFLVEKLRQGDISALGKAITYVESNLDKHRNFAYKIIEKSLPFSGNSLRIGITGVPGVGKSTFIESFGIMLTQQGKKVAVLAIDPTSKKSGGSILGDKTRMEELSRDENAFIRPSAAGDSLGGVARKTKETIILCEAAGYDIIIIETVGVGQSEIEVKGMVDFFLLLMLAGAGDELQGIKRGIMEMADALVINKADGDNLQKAKLAKAEYTSALHLFPPSDNDWVSPVLMCSALKGEGVEDIWKLIAGYRLKTNQSGYFQENRKRQNLEWMNKALKEEMYSRILSNPEVRKIIEEVKQRVSQDQISPFQAVEMILGKVKKI